MTAVELETPHGPARAHIEASATARAALILGHGAGGGVGARDLTTVAGAAQRAGLTTVLVEQPYRVAGRRSPAPAAQLDNAWRAVVEQLRAGPLRALPLITGGRSSGARVACRTAADTGASGVLCLAFPFRAPARVGTAEKPSRLAELEAVDVPVLVVQGSGDPFGVPPAGPGRVVVTVRGNHSLTSELPAVALAVGDWLERVLT